MRRPPSDFTNSWSLVHSARTWAMSACLVASSRPSSASIASIIFSMLPPSTMSVPRPAMLVAMVIIFVRPACATMSASRACCLALSTWCGRPAFSSRASMISEFSIDEVPTSTGWPRS
ncbi:hypothetical protein D3C72_1257090 [compost metagenome]